MNEVAELELPTQDNVRTDLRSVFQGAIRLVLELVLEEDPRNGLYLRKLITSMGVTAARL